MADLQKFTNNVRNHLNGKTVGWAFAVYQGTTLKFTDSGGMSVLSPQTKMTPQTRMGVMSMSKTVTAAALVCAMPWMSVKPDSLIGPLLPSNWKKGPKVDQLTFRMLLTHTSGLQPVSGGPDGSSLAYDNLRKMVANGVSGSVPAPGAYLNEGYGLLRVLLATMWYSPATVVYWDTEYPGEIGKIIGQRYVSLCQSTVLADPSLHALSVVPTGSTPYTNIYDFQQTAQHSPSGDPSDILHTGPDHWYMSAQEYGRFAAELRLGTYLAGPMCWNTMSQTRAPNAPAALPPYPNGDARLGVWRFAGKNGEYFGHNGGYQFGPTNQNVVGSFAGWMAFPGGVTAAFVANSNLWFGIEQEKILMDSFDAA